MRGEGVSGPTPVVLTPFQRTMGMYLRCPVIVDATRVNFLEYPHLMHWVSSSVLTRLCTGAVLDVRLKDTRRMFNRAEHQEDHQSLPRRIQRAAEILRKTPHPTDETDEALRILEGGR